jgi:hypothetical protein
LTSQTSRIVLISGTVLTAVLDARKISHKSVLTAIDDVRDKIVQLESNS